MDNRLQDYGATLLRISLGVIFLAHSAYLKVFVFTIPGTVGFFESLGLPAISAYTVLLAEIAGGLMLFLGVRVREVAATLAVVSLGATWVHSGAGWLFTNSGGGWEYPLFLTVACLAQGLLGPGALRLRVSERRVSRAIQAHA